jgi:hypothetical protein
VFLLLCLPPLSRFLPSHFWWRFRLSWTEKWRWR